METMNKNCKIYKISFEGTDRVYIGSTVNLEARIRKHLGLLCKGNHHSAKLQNFIKKYKLTPVIEVVDECSTKDRQTVEQYWIDKYNSLHYGFNMVPAEYVLDSEDKFELAKSALERKAIDERKVLMLDKDFSDKYYALISLLRTYGNIVRPDLQHISVEFLNAFNYKKNTSIKNLKESFCIAVPLFNACTEKLTSSCAADPVYMYVNAAYRGYAIIKEDVLVTNTKTFYELFMQGFIKTNRYDKSKLINIMIQQDYNEKVTDA